MPENNRIVVNLEQPAAQPAPPVGVRPNAATPAFANQAAAPPPKKRRGCGTVLLVLGAVMALFVVGAGVWAYWSWTSLQKSPSYSLALLINAARKDDRPALEKYLDTDTVVDNFVPQITEKARERYGRSFPPEVVARATQILQQVLPSVKERAKREIPRIIKEKAQAAPEVSPWMLALGINRVVDVQETGDAATLKSTLQNRSFELNMQRDGDHWKVTGLKDEALADRIVNEIGQKILAEANKKTTGKQSGKGTLEDIRRQIEQLSIP